MNREHKYRAWDGEKMYYTSLEDVVSAMGSQCSGEWTLEEQVGEELAGFAGRLTYPRKQMVYMEYIGRLDHHEPCQDIYEGDIVEYIDNTSRGLVKKIAVIRDIRHLPDFSCSKWEEIIGNCYEHPELLKEAES